MDLTQVLDYISTAPALDIPTILSAVTDRVTSEIGAGVTEAVAENPIAAEAAEGAVAGEEAADLAAAGAGMPLPFPGI
jgi:hypothetical protein